MTKTTCDNCEAEAQWLYKTDDEVDLCFVCFTNYEELQEVGGEDD